MACRGVPRSSTCSWPKQSVTLKQVLADHIGILIHLFDGPGDHAHSVDDDVVLVTGEADDFQDVVAVVHLFVVHLFPTVVAIHFGYNDIGVYE